MEDVDQAKLLAKFVDTITGQLRTFGVELYDVDGNRIRPSSAEEQRIVRGIARNCVQILVLEQDCQTAVPSSYTTMTPEEQWAHDKAHGRLDDES